MEEKAVAAVDCVGLRHLSGVWAEGSDGARISGFLKVAWEIHGTKENWKRSQHAFTQCVCVPECVCMCMSVCVCWGVCVYACTCVPVRLCIHMCKSQRLIVSSLTTLTTSWPLSSRDPPVFAFSLLGLCTSVPEGWFFVLFALLFNTWIMGN
jgi:hypothetical protein